MLKTSAPTIEQIARVRGQWQKTPANQIATMLDTSAGPVWFVALAEVHGSGPNLQAHEQQLVKLVQESYQAARGGITAGLRRALSTANQWLYAHNQSISPEERLRAGLAAAIIQENDLFIIQIGSVGCYTRLNEFTRRHPESEAEFDRVGTNLDNLGPALGDYPVIEPALFHFHTEPGDTLILTTHQLTLDLTPQDVGQIVASNPKPTIGQTLVSLAEATECACLVAQLGDTPATADPVYATAYEEPSEPTNNGKHFDFSMPAFLNNQNSDHGSNRHSTTSSGFSLDATQVLDTGQRWARQLLAAAAAFLALLGSGFQTLLKLVLPGQDHDDMPVRRAGVQAYNDDAPPERTFSPALLLGIAIGLPLLALAITGLIYWQRGYQEEQTYTNALTTAQTAFQQATTTTTMEAQVYLQQADLALEEAIALRGTQPEIETLQAQIAAQRDEMEQVERLTHVPVLQRYDGNADLQQLIVQGVDLYVFDAGQHTIYKHGLADTGDSLRSDPLQDILMQSSTQIEGAALGAAIDIIWMPTGGGRQASELLVLTDSGLFGHNPSWGRTTRLNLSLGSDDMTPVSIGSYFGNFYILDRQANQIHRFLPTTDGYSNAPEAYFAAETEVNLSNAVDMAIDGAVYVLYQDGRVQKFLGGKETPFTLKGLLTPLNNPTAIYTAPDESVQYLYITDAGNRRISQFTKDGQLVRHFQPPVGSQARFDDLRSIFVDEIGEKMFVLNGNSLYAVNITNLLPTPATADPLADPAGEAAGTNN